MSNVDDANLIPFALPILFDPVLDRLEGDHAGAAKAVRLALINAEAKQPGLLLETAKELLKQSQLDDAVNVQEIFLRHQGDLPATEFPGVPKLNPDLSPASASTRTLHDLTDRAHKLRKILSRIPDEMSDRRKFLETIKEIASCIKKLLDATNALLALVPPTAKPRVEQRKREFVKFSKRFSNTLKEYFKGDTRNLVFVSANQLINQTGLIVKVARELEI